MKLLQDVKTYENLQVLMTELDAVNLGLSGDTTGDLVAIVEKDAPTFAKQIILFLKDKNISDKKSAVDELVTLSKDLEGVETLELTIAFDPNEEATEEIYSWVMENVDKNVVLEYKRNPSIMSGALVSYKGKYGDFSGAKDLKEAFVGFRKEMKI